MGSGLSLWLKRLGRESDHSLPSSAEVKNGGAIPPLPLLRGVVLNEAQGLQLTFTARRLISFLQ
jgi:hypothetical protein